ncbi:hypothetical protein ACTQ56_12675 [[Clostridium] aminophilum]|uniref:hypothetical protein n=1 Tax=[Clostridium] aminophilum TaxID=1526 RepID=UPI0026ED4215|nr:hypothetical protein [[Clostridium] aminophilum]MDD6196480.1 hypothetical protein [[Clostridium] aminophilum]
MLTFVFCMPGKNREAECESAFMEIRRIFPAFRQKHSGICMPHCGKRTMNNFFFENFFEKSACNIRFPVVLYMSRCESTDEKNKDAEVLELADRQD